MRKMYKNMKIGMKILLVVLCMSLGTQALVFLDAYISIHKLGDAFRETNVSLGLTASDDSREALQKQAEEYLVKIAQKQAMYSNEKLSEISRIVTSAAGYAAYLYAHPERFAGELPPLPNETTDGEYCAKYMLAPGVSMTDSIRREVELLSNCEAVFAPNLSGNTMLDNIYIGTASGISYRYSASNSYDPSYDPRKNAWYRHAAENPDKTIWLNTYLDSYGNICITCARTFRDAQGSVAGVAASDIRLRDLLNEITAVKIGQSGYAFVIDSDRSLIAHPNYPEGSFQNDIAAYIETDSSQMEKVRELGGEASGIVSLILDGVDSYVAFSTLEETDWRLCISVDCAEVVQPALDTKAAIDAVTDDAQTFTQGILTSVMRRFILFFIAVAVLVALISLVVSRSITRPIQRLSENAVRIGKGELDRKVEVTSSDEIGSLAAAFNRMLDDLHDYINQITLVTAEKERIGAELSVAAQIQADMLPNIFPAFPEREEIDIHAVMTPAKEVGGDFYDFFMVDDTHIAVVMADVSGKGVPAALFMVIGKTLIKDHTIPGAPLGEVFTEVNRLLCEANEEGLFITAFEGVLDLESGHMAYVNAGHEPPFIADKDGTYRLFPVKPQFVLAGMDGMQYTQGELEMNAGDRIFLYTDGVTEATDKNQELYGMKRLEQALNRGRNLPPAELLGAVKSDIDCFVGDAEQFDDITMLGMVYRKSADKAAEKKNVLTLPADISGLDTVTSFVDAYMEKCGCDARTKGQIDIVAEEIFVNICSYAYHDRMGEVDIEIFMEDGKRKAEAPPADTGMKKLILVFSDSGIKYNPLEKPDPDITQSAQEREFGGLGIYMVKNIADDIFYDYMDGKNILKIVKKYKGYWRE